MRNLITLVLVMAFIPALNAAASESLVTDPLFQSDEILDITLTAPFGLIDRERDKEQEYDATLSYQDENRRTNTLNVELEVRGNNRLRKDLCSYSQLWVDFKKQSSQNTVFENQDKIKLVVQCRGQDRYQDYIVRELQAYQLFSQLSDMHFATRAVRVTYVDSERPDSSRTHLAFFIEHQEQLAQRFGMEEFEDKQILLRQLNQQHSSLVAMFMYMISNTDYSMIQGTPGEDCCHNTKLIESAEGDYYPIPYDFDASGYVDTSYAEPNQALRQRRVRQRIYRGFCVSEQVMENTLATFREQRSAMEEIIGDTSLVRERVARRSRDYIDDFYEVLNDPAKLQAEIIDECRG